MQNRMDYSRLLKWVGMTHLSSIIRKYFKPSFFNWTFVLPKNYFPRIRETKFQQLISSGKVVKLCLLEVLVIESARQNFPGIHGFFQTQAGEKHHVFSINYYRLINLK